MRCHLPLALASSLCLLSAQQTDAAASAPPQVVVGLRAAGIQQLIAQWPTTRLGRLLADEDVAPAAATVLRMHTLEAVRRRELHAAAMSGNYEIDPWLLSWIAGGRFEPMDLFDTPFAETTQVEMLALMREHEPFQATTALVRSCTPRHEGKWTQAFEREAMQLRASLTLREQPDAKIEGYPAYCFAAPDPDDQGAPASSRWMLHLPGRFLRLAGSNPDGVLAVLSERAAPGLSIFNSCTASMAQFAQHQHTPPEFLLLGFDKLDQFEWRVSIAGEQVLDEIIAITNAAPTGVVGAVVNGKGELPKQPLPVGALVQLRCALDLPSVIPLLTEQSIGIALPPPLLEQLQKALTGGVAIGICAPPPGGLIPRFHLTLGIADRELLDALLGQFVTDGVPHKVAEYEGVACTILQLPDVPNGLQPAFCIVDNQLHLAESPRTLRKFLQLLADGGEAMAIGDVALPEGAGEMMPTLDLRYDEAGIYRAYYETWLPLLELTLTAAQQEQVLKKEQLPEPDLVAEHCGFGRGVLRRDGKRFVLQQQGTFGGIDTLSLALLWGPLIAGQMRDSMADNLGEAIARHQLAAVQEAFAAFETREQRRPKDLAELFTAQRLPADALLLPGDDLAEPVLLADGTATRSSYRYYPATTNYDVGNGGGEVLLIEIRAHAYQRSVLSADGVVHQDYTMDSRRPIEAFGEAGR